MRTRLAAIASFIVLVVALVIGAAAPFGRTPGFLIGGTATAVPDSWDHIRDVKEVLLQVGSGPIGRTVTIWVVETEGDLYVVGERQNGWVSDIGDGGDVRLRISDYVYALYAQPISENAVEVLTAWQEKYQAYYPDMMRNFPSPADQAKSAIAFKLTAR